MPTPLYTGSISVPPLGSFASATSVPATFAGAVQTGPNPYSFISTGDIQGSRTATTGLAMLGGGTERGVLDYGITNAHATTLSGIGGSSTGNFIATGTVEATSTGAGTTPSFVPPGYSAAGVALGANFHIVSGTITAGGASTTVNLVGAARFTTFVTLVVYDQTALAAAVITSYPGNSFAFTSVNGHVYQYFLCGV